MKWEIFQWMKFLFRLFSNSRKLSRQKFHNELACVFTAQYARKNADWNQQQLTDGGVLASWNSANHPYCFLSNQKKSRFWLFCTWSVKEMHHTLLPKTDHRDKRRVDDRRLSLLLKTISYWTTLSRHASMTGISFRGFSWMWIPRTSHQNQCNGRTKITNKRDLQLAKLVYTKVSDD